MVLAVIIESLKVFLMQYGLLAMFLVAAAGSALIPIPSTVAVPFGGFLAFQGYFSLWALVLLATLGNLVGSLVSYYLGSKIIWLSRFKYFREHIETSQKFFDKYGTKAVFFGQMLPGVRIFISLPAGIAKVPLLKFVFLAIAGAFPRNLILSCLGYFLGANWEIVHTYGLYLSILVILSFVGVYFYFKKAVSGKF